MDAILTEGWKKNLDNWIMWNKHAVLKLIMFDVTNYGFENLCRKWLNKVFHTTETIYNSGNEEVSINLNPCPQSDLPTFLTFHIPILNQDIRNIRDTWKVWIWFLA